MEDPHTSAYLRSPVILIDLNGGVGRYEDGVLRHRAAREVIRALN